MRPKPLSSTESLILSHMKLRRPITEVEAKQFYKINRVSFVAAIKSLRERGHVITLKTQLIGTGQKIYIAELDI